ncbi:sensor domain-containing diguanylate cyclase [Pseudothermotoga sp. U03pept]|uniref:sensor domain-containing diguanylate cyclase n=1 Tax=Pseudothermotoga sp. U03pept TaxID=3447012 RepID=UPI003F08B028
MKDAFIWLSKENILPCAVFENGLEIQVNQLFKSYISSQQITLQEEINSVVKQSMRRLGATITHFVDQCDLWQSLTSISMKDGKSVYTLLVVEPNRAVVRHAQTIMQDMSVSPVVILSKQMTVLYCNKVEFRQLPETHPQEWQKLLKIAKTSIESQCVCQDDLSIDGRVLRVTAKPQNDEVVMILRDKTVEKLAQDRYEQLRVAGTRFTLMENILDLLGRGETDLERIGAQIYEEVKNIVPIDVFYLALIEGDELIIRYGVYYGEKVTDIKIKRGYTGLSNYVIDTGKFTYIPNTRTMRIAPYRAKALVFGETKRVWSYVGIPLRVDEKIVGTISFQRQGANAFSVTHLALFELIGKQITIALRMKMLVDELKNERSKYREIAIRDSLTECYTRYYLAEYFAKFQGIIERKGGKICFVMIDVDNFKQINDRYGHAVGDKVLKELGHLLLQSTRKMDLVVRYGGDEFLLMLLDMDLKSGKKVMERVSKKLSELKIPDLDEEITLSYGMAVYDGSTTLDEILKIADKNMYNMKRGKNP